MKLRLLAAISLMAPFLATAQTSWSEDREADSVWINNFDEAYSVYLDGTNRTAGLKGLTSDVSAPLWQVENSDQDIVSVENDVLTIEHTRLYGAGNYDAVSLQTTGWATEGVSPFAHIAAAEGGELKVMGGQFVDMSIDGMVSVSFMAKTDQDCELRVDIVDANGRQGNGKLQYDYENTQHVQLEADYGWETYIVMFSYELFDYYSGSYWDANTGMWDGDIGVVKNGAFVDTADFAGPGTYMWALDENGDTLKHEIAQEDPIPVSNSAISKLMFIVDDVLKGDEGVTKNVQIKDLVVGSVEFAVDFVPFTEENIAAGLIEYNPENVVQVRAHQDIDWPTDPVGVDLSVTALNSMESIDLTETNNSASVYLPDYFESKSALEYSCRFLGGTSSVFNIEVDNYSRKLYVSLTNPTEESIEIVEVTATNEYGYSATQPVYLIFEPDFNQKPYVVKSFDDIIYQQGFGSDTIDFSGYFADPEGDELMYLIMIDQYDEGNPVKFPYPDDYYFVDEFASLYSEYFIGVTAPSFTLLEESTGSTTITIYAFEKADEMNFVTYAETSFIVSIEGESTPVAAVGTIPDIRLIGFLDYQYIDLNEYFTSSTQLTYSYEFVSGSTSSFWVDLDDYFNELEITNLESQGKASIKITATDAAGNTASQLINVSSIEDSNAGPYVVKDFEYKYYEEGFGSNTIDFSGYFADPEGDELIYFITIGDGEGSQSVAFPFPGDYYSSSAMAGEYSPYFIGVTEPSFTLLEQATGSTTVTISAFEKADEQNYKKNATASFIVSVGDGIVPVATVGSIPDVTLMDSYDDQYIDLTDYFFASTDLSYSYEIVAGSEVSFNIEIDDDLDELLVSGVLKAGPATIKITATDAAGNTASQVVQVDYSQSAQTGPELVNNFEDVYYDEGFGSAVIDFSGYFADPDGDGLIYFIVLDESLQNPVLFPTTGDYYGGEEFADNFDEYFIGVTEPSFTLLENGTGSTTVFVFAFKTLEDLDNDNYTVTYFTVNVGDDIPYVSAIGSIDDVVLSENNLSQTVYVYDYFASNSSLTYSYEFISGSSESFYVDLDDAFGELSVYKSSNEEASAVIEVTATDSDGNTARQIFTVEYTDEASVVATGNISDIYWFEDEGNASATVLLSDYFSSTTALTYDYLFISGSSSSFEIAIEEYSGGYSNDLLFIQSSGESATATVLITATDEYGNTATQTVNLVYSSEVNTAPYQVKEFQDLEYEQGFGSAVIDFTGYFTDDEGDDLFYYVIIDAENGVVPVALPYPGDYYIDGYGISEDYDRYFIGVETPLFTLLEQASGSIEIYVIAFEKNSFQSSQEAVFTVTVKGNGTFITPTNKAPYLKKPLNSLVLEQGFGSMQLNLTGYFADPEGDALEYLAYTSDSNSPVHVELYAGESTPFFSLQENGTGLTTVYIDVNDGENHTVESFDVYVQGTDADQIAITDEVVLIYVDEGTASIDLSEYISPEENLTFTVSGESFPSQTLDLQQETGLASYEVTAQDQFGHKTSYTAVVAFEKSSSSVSTFGIPDLYIERGLETVNLSYFFDGLGLNYSIAASGEDIGSIYLDGGMLVIDARSSGKAEVTIMATDINGGYVIESFKITSSIATVKTAEVNSDVTVYPTVANETITVENAQGTKVFITDMNGFVVKTEKIMTQKETIDVSILQSGIYALVAGKQIFKIIKE